MKTTLLFIIALALIGSARSDDNVAAPVKAASTLKIPLPTTTPYDSDSKARAIYLEEYTTAYRLILTAEMGDCHMLVKGPYENAMRDGWNDGKQTAMEKHPEKVAQMWGMSLEDYLRYLQYRQQRDIAGKK